MLGINKYTSDEKISRFIVLYFFLQALNTSIKLVFPIGGALWSALSLFFGSLIAWLFLCAVKSIYHRSAKVVIISFFSCFILYTLSVLMSYGHIDCIINSAKWTFFFCLPIGLSAYSIYDYKILYKYFYKISFPLGIIIMASSYGIINQVNMEGEYDMSMGVAMVIPILFQLNHFFNYEKKLFNFLFIIFEILFILVFASRSPIICIVIFILLNFIYSKRNSLYKFLIILLSFLVSFIVYINFTRLLIFFVDTLERLGIHSRTLSMMLIGETANLSSRDIIWEHCLDMILEKPFLGWGVAGELYELTIRRQGAFIPGHITTSHNIFLELMLNFGIIMGIIISLVLFLSFTRNKKLGDSCFASIFLIFYSSIFTNFIGGDGFWVKPTIAILVFLFLKTFSKKRKMPCSN